jgi:hypothetical protein
MQKALFHLQNKLAVINGQMAETHRRANPGQRNCGSKPDSMIRHIESPKQDVRLERRAPNSNSSSQRQRIVS